MASSGKTKLLFLSIHPPMLPTFVTMQVCLKTWQPIY